MPKTDTHKKLIIAALKLVATHDWKQITLEQIAKAAKVPLAQVSKSCGTTNDLLAAIVTYIDDETAAEIGKPLTQGPARDRLFEVMMARFDILQKHRVGICGIMASVKRDPSLARVLLPANVQAMQKMLALAGLKQDGLKDALATAGLLAVYGASLFCWERDRTKDMAPTMAALDRHLRRADKIAAFVFNKI